MDVDGVDETHHAVRAMGQVWSSQWVAQEFHG